MRSVVLTSRHAARSLFARHHRNSLAAHQFGDAGAALALRLFAVLDQSGTGHLEWPEFCYGIYVWRQGDRTDKLNLIFLLHASDGEYMKKSEFRAMLKTGVTCDPNNSLDKKEKADKSNDILKVMEAQLAKATPPLVDDMVNHYFARFSKASRGHHYDGRGHDPEKAMSFDDFTAFAKENEDVERLINDMLEPQEEASLPAKEYGQQVARLHDSDDQVAAQTLAF